MTNILFNRNQSKMLDFMELNTILGTNFTTYKQFDAYADKNYNMSIKSLLGHLDYKQIAKLIKLSIEKDDMWVLEKITAMRVFEKEVESKRKYFYRKAIIQREFLLNYLLTEGDLDKTIQMSIGSARKPLTLFGKEYKTLDEALGDYDTLIKDKSPILTEFRNLHNYLLHLENTYIEYQNIKVISARQLAILLRTTSQMLIPLFKYHNKEGSLTERQESFNRMFQRFQDMRKVYKNLGGKKETYPTLEDFLDITSLGVNEIVNAFWAPVDIGTIQTRLQMGSSVNLTLGCFERIVLVNNFETTLDQLSIITNKSVEQLNNLIIHGFDNNFVEQRLLEIVKKNGFYDYRIKVIMNNERNEFLDKLFNIELII